MGFAFLDVPHPIAFAHRGGTSDAPENTMPAFAHAIELGYRYVETDVHLTADGVVVAFHDASLDRVTDRTGRISDLPWTVVREARVGGSERIPTLEELLTAWPQVRVNIDPKHDAVVEPLAEVLRTTAAVDRVCVGAFSDRRLGRIRRILPGICTSLGPRSVAKLRAASFGVPLRRLPAPCAQVPPGSTRAPLVDERFVVMAHRLGLAVHVWTIDDPDEMHRLLDLGVDGIMTDRPAVLRAVLEARGQWPDGAS